MNEGLVSAEVLEARHFCYMALQSAFGVEPSAAQLDALRSEETRGWFQGLFADEGLAKAVERFFLAAEDADLDCLRSNYTRLFIGPGQLAAGPWESIYVNAEPLLFVESTVDVRKAYLAQGYAPRLFPNVADDHIALELDFMKRLAERMRLSISDGNEGGFASARDASASFLNEHLLKWDERFAAKVREAGGEYFSCAADLLTAFLKADAAFLAAIAE